MARTDIYLGTMLRHLGAAYYESLHGRAARSDVGRRAIQDADALAAGARPEGGWHPDATWRLIQLLAGLGLIYKVRKPKVKVYFAAKQLVPNSSLRQTHREWHIEKPAEAQELLAS